VASSGQTLMTTNCFTRLVRNCKCALFERIKMTNHEWVTAHKAWQAFTADHPELGYQAGKWGLHNFLRRYRQVLVMVDAIRLAKGRFWVAHLSRFKAAAFDCATGLAPPLSGRPVAAGTDTQRSTFEGGSS
jgi:hypothetical protein